jgi:hypothetical protein
MDSFATGLVGAVVMGAVFYFLIDSLRAWGERRANPWALFLISALGDDATFQIERCEKLLGKLGAFGQPFVLEAVVPHVGDRVHFYVAVQVGVAVKAARALRRLFGRFAVERVHDDHIVFSPHGAAACAHLAQKEFPALPIPLYRETGADLWDDVLGALRAVSHIGEGAAVQIVAVPLRAQTFLRSCRGVPLPRVAHEKCAEPLFAVNVRLVASAGSAFRARDILGSMCAAFERFRGQERNALRAVYSRSSHAVVRQFLSRSFEEGQSLILSVSELASIYHIGAVVGGADLYSAPWESESSPIPTGRFL